MLNFDKWYEYYVKNKSTFSDKIIADNLKKLEESKSANVETIYV